MVYQYDELERLISASTTAGGNWGLTWNYDGFGNRLSQNVSQGSGPANVVLVNGNTNRISSSGYGYDLNGNMTQMPQGTGSMTLNYDLSNRVSSISSSSGTEDYVYAPDNRRVWRSAGRTSCAASRGQDGEWYWGGVGEGIGEQVVFYSPGGQKLGVYCVSFTVHIPNANTPTSYYAVTASEENVYYGGRLVGKRMIAASTGSSLVTDFTTDRLQSKGDGSRFYPYGESKTGAGGDDREQFATYTRDERSGLDYADQRWYASGVGRFGSPDPYEASAGAGEPGTWNRYAYVGGDPTNFFDPEGLAATGTSPTVPTWVQATQRSAPSAPGTAPASPNIYNVFAQICIGKRCVTSQVNTASVLGRNTSSDLMLAQSWHENRISFDKKWEMSKADFEQKYKKSQETINTKYGGKGYLAFQGCFDRSANHLLTGNGGMPSFALYDDAIRMADTILSVLNRTQVGPNGERSEMISELQLLVRRLLYDDAPDIGGLRSRAADITTEIHQADITECVRNL